MATLLPKYSCIVGWSDKLHAHARISWPTKMLRELAISVTTYRRAALGQCIHVATALAVFAGLGRTCFRDIVLLQQRERGST